MMMDENTDKPILIVMTGLPGTGKSFIAERLKEKTNAKHVLTDEIREIFFPIRRFGSLIKYSGDISRAVHHIMYLEIENELHSGHNVIADATFLRTETHSELLNLSLKTSSEIIFIKTDCDEDIAKKRLEKRIPIREHYSEATFKIYSNMKRRLEESDDKYIDLEKQSSFLDKYNISLIVIDTSEEENRIEVINPGLLSQEIRNLIE